MRDNDKRRYPRFPIECRGVAINGRQMRAVEIKDISRNGALFACHFPSFFKKQEKLKLCFFDGDSGTFCHAEACAVRMFAQDHLLFVGVTFNDQNASIVRVINSRKSGLAFAT